MLLNMMKKWGGKYSTKGEAWETLKRLCASSDIQLQGVLAETEKEVIPEQETKADIVDEENAETSPLLTNEEHNENSGKEVLAKSELDQVNSNEAAKKTRIIIENNTEGTMNDAEIGKEEVVTSDGTREIQGKRQPAIAEKGKAEIGKEEVVTSDGTREIQGKRQPAIAEKGKAEIGKEVVTSDGTREIQGKRQPEIANFNMSHIKGTQAEQDMIVLHKNTQGNVVYTNESSINKGRQTEGSTDREFSGKASQTATERAKSGKNVHRVSEETKPSTSSREREDPSESSSGAKSGSKQTAV